MNTRKMTNKKVEVRIKDLTVVEGHLVFNVLMRLDWIISYDESKTTK
jgi:hypothetical protein